VVAIYTHVLLLDKYSKDIKILIAAQTTDSGQKYSDTSNFPFIIHIKQQLTFVLSCNQFISDRGGAHIEPPTFS
jgi:hypothetical protein